MNTLTTPICIGNITIKNRLVLPPMATSKAVNGRVTKFLLDYYQEKSFGGYLGLVITEHSFVEEIGRANEHQTSIASDDDIPGLKELTEVIHANGSVAFAQISHAGSKAKPENDSKKPIGPSSISLPNHGIQLEPQEMTKIDIENVVQAFANAALRAKIAGFDGIEIHSAHGYLLNQFYSPILNKRTDEFGGDVYHRIHLHTLIIREIRKLVGTDYPLILRLGACDYLENGNTIDDAEKASLVFEKEGIHAIHISGGIQGYTRAGHPEQGYFKDASARIKNKVKIPVILTGGIYDVKEVERLLRENKADMIGVGRPILKDSFWAKKAIESMLQI